MRTAVVSATRALPQLVARVPATVHAKLLVGFLVIVVLLIVLGVVGLQVLSRANQRSDDVVKRHERIAAYRKFQQDASLPPSWSWNQSTLEATLQRLTQFGYELDQLQFGATDDVELLARVHEKYDELIRLIGQVAELIKAEKITEARTLQLTQASPLADSLERFTNDLVNRAETKLEASIEASQSAYATSRWRVIEFAIGSIGLALILGYAISWSLIGPVELLDSRLRLIASGDFSQRVAVPNRDELGALSTQFNRMAAQLQESYAKLEDRTHQLTEALDQQTATSEVLKVLSSSPTDVQPVFDTISRSGAALCDAEFGGVFRYDGQLVHLVARNSPDRMMDAVAQTFPMPPSRGGITARAILEGQSQHVSDITDDPEYANVDLVRAGFRSTMSTPMLRDGTPIGAITVARSEAREFTRTQVALLQTFAAQAVIAIENVRLFTELQEKNRALIQAHAQATQALEQQTATAELLKVIGRSTSDLEPVFKTLAENAVRLCEAEQASIFRFDGRLLQAVVTHNLPAAQRDMLEQNPILPGRGSGAGRAASERRTVHIHDVQADPEYTYGGRVFFRTLLAVPMFRASELLGAISIQRDEVRPFTDNHIALMETFADQAAIAIENVRLFNELGARTAELTRSVEELTALAEVSRALGSTLNLDTVLATIVARAIQLSEMDAGTIWEYDPTSDVFHLRAAGNLEEDIVSMLRATPLKRGEGTVGRLADTRAPIQIADILEESPYRGRLEVIVRSGYRAILSVPLVLEDQLIGALTVNAKTPRECPPAVVDLLTTFATQSALAIQNARLFREIEQKSRELAVASQHKSEFLANMSHELRTPLNAVIGFSEVLVDRMFGELNEKQEEYLEDIHASGQHLLSLINDILDLSKIEAGKMELELSEVDLPMTIDNALALVRERAARRGIALHTAVEERLPQIQADGRKIRQVLLNLLSNAIKFTPEGGRIEVAAKRVDGCIEVSVSDTGVGIAPGDHEAVFEEFRQVGSADKKIEGTGLGLALSRKFVELHGGKIWVKSQVGAGSTFTFTVPV